MYPIYTVSFRQWALLAYERDVNELAEDDPKRLELLQEYIDAMAVDEYEREAQSHL